MLFPCRQDTCPLPRVCRTCWCQHFWIGLQVEEMPFTGLNSHCILQGISTRPKIIKDPYQWPEVTDTETFQLCPAVPGCARQPPPLPPIPGKSPGAKKPWSLSGWVAECCCPTSRKAAEEHDWWKPEQRWHQVNRHSATKKTLTFWQVHATNIIISIISCVFCQDVHSWTFAAVSNSYLAVARSERQSQNEVPFGSFWVLRIPQQAQQLRKVLLASRWLWQYYWYLRLLLLLRCLFWANAAARNVRKVQSDLRQKVVKSWDQRNQRNQCSLLQTTHED